MGRLRQQIAVAGKPTQKVTGVMVAFSVEGPGHLAMMAFAVAASAHDRRSCASALPEDLMSHPLLRQSERPGHATLSEVSPGASARAYLLEQHPGPGMDAATARHLLSLHRQLNIPLDATVHCLCRVFGIEIGALAQASLCSRTHLYRCLVGERLPSQRMREALTQSFGCDPWDQSVPTARRQLTHRLAQCMPALRNHG